MITDEYIKAIEEVIGDMIDFYSDDLHDGTTLNGLYNLHTNVVEAAVIATAKYLKSNEMVK